MKKRKFLRKTPESRKVAANEFAFYLRTNQELHQNSEEISTAIRQDY